MPQQQAPNAKRLEIKKYSNRRFYDSSHSRHVKLEEIGALIRDGHEVRITDAQNGHDITCQVLVRIILELDPSALDSLSVSDLVGLIRGPNRAPLPSAPNFSAALKARPAAEPEVPVEELQNADLHELLRELKRQDA